MRKVVNLFFVLILISQVTSISGQDTNVNQSENCDFQFDGEKANSSVSFQTSLGPRVPGSEASSALRDSIKQNLTGWRIIETTHFVDGMILTNLFATWNYGLGSEVILAAHYDTRDRAERDPNPNLTMTPILGANDGASGVAALIELGRIIPSMNLNHEITLFFTDGEDQGEFPSYLGAKAWSENLSYSEADKIESFILLDMIGDADLTVSKAYPGNDTLWERVEESIEYLGETCENYNSDYYDNSTMVSVGDDHVWAIAKGIPAIDIIDIKYGPNATAFGGHWHTHNDTADKVSAESLSKIGILVEYGLKEGIWLDVRNTPESDSELGVDSEITEKVEDEKIVENTSVALLFIAMILIVWGNLLYFIIADKQTKV
ncbi:MAG: M28 family peptidase [Candidatus Poseidoniaceae archaeon]